MKGNVTGIKRRITISVSVSFKILKNIIWAKKIIFESMLQVVVKIVNI